jgi:hypothetical protein
MSLTDGTKKMSKSDPSDLSRIDLIDPPEVIRKKVKRCRVILYEDWSLTTWSVQSVITCSRFTCCCRGKPRKCCTGMC